MLRVANGDAFKGFRSSKKSILAHGVNCRGKFASGFAAQVAKHYPTARTRYLGEYHTVGWYLGKVQMVHISDYQWIANCATQDKYGYDGDLYVDYEALRRVGDVLATISKMQRITIHMPMIGCGLAGGDEDRMLDIMNTCFRFTNTNCIVWRYK